ncbi:MAG: nickel pincer cofactor biosynthesis protein LarC [Peptococcaceae bacterium]|jgi:uncharacterized protein (TIGR00299 family) protein|nr:nickel pincer cofactor biosynthesis protein LarC [Peptococcaceae bacterium]
MRILYIECDMGAAGDMLLAALLELLPDPGGFVEKMNAWAIPGVKIRAFPAVKCGITGTGVSVTVAGEEEESRDVGPGDMATKRESKSLDEHGHERGAEHEHIHEHESEQGHTHEHGHEHANEQGSEHGHEHSPAHSHTGLSEIRQLIDHLPLPAKVKDDALAVYTLLAAAEARAHGRPVEMIHFHEVGAMDAVADIVGVCALLAEIAPERIIVSPIHVGSGQTRCAHGILPVPAPATADILRGAPTYAGGVKGELCTPTGAALLKHFAHHFGDRPLMVTEAIGYGMGKKDFPAANCVRVFLGAAPATGTPGPGAAAEATASAVYAAGAGADATDVAAASDVAATAAGTAAGVSGTSAAASGAAGQSGQTPTEVEELVCNVDDMTGEEIGFALETLLEQGALDAFAIPAQMKKNRPGQMLVCLCEPGEADRLAALMLRHTSTFGVRGSRWRRYVLDREIATLATSYGPIRLKTGVGYGVTKRKAEYEDLARLARERNIPLAKIRGEIQAEIRAALDCPADDRQDGQD